MGIDLLMSLDPHWFSSIYGLYFVISQGLAALTFTVLVVIWLGKRPPMSRRHRSRDTCTTTASCSSPS